MWALQPHFLPILFPSTFPLSQTQHYIAKQDTELEKMSTLFLQNVCTKFILIFLSCPSFLCFQLREYQLCFHFGFSIVSFPHKRNTNPFSLYFLNLPMNIMEKHQISSWPQAKSQAYEVNSIDFQFCTHKDIQNRNGRLCFNELIWFNECTSTATHSLVQCYLIYLHNLLPDIWT